MSKETMTAEEFRQLMADTVNNRPGTGGNRKVRNAQKVERDGVVFDSKLETYMHDLLILHKVPFEFQKRYELQPAFEYAGATIRAITYTVDFELSDLNLIIDTKGYKTQQGTMRVKMLKNHLSRTGRTPQIELPQTKDECAALVREIVDRTAPVND